MKVTPEEKLMLIRYSGFIGRELGMPMDREAVHTWGRLVDEFERVFNEHAELMRAPKTYDNLKKIAESMGKDAVEFFEGTPYKPVVECSVRSYPHDHVICESEASNVECTDCGTTILRDDPIYFCDDGKLCAGCAAASDLVCPRCSSQKKAAFYCCYGCSTDDVNARKPGSTTSPSPDRPPRPIRRA